MRVLMMLPVLWVFAACEIVPRGAALQSEILVAAAPSEEGEMPEFAVEPITRDNLATYLRWPDIDPAHLRWIERVDQPNNRIIVVGDKVNITVWTTENDGLLTSGGQRFVTFPEMTVSSGGQVFLPYIGDMKISGMSPERARAKIEEAYADALQSAQVQLQLVEGINRTVSLVGGVRTPGTFTLPHSDFTILELLADGGGIDPSINNPQVRMQRNGELYGVSAARLLSQPRLNTTLNGGDRVFVEADDRVFLSLGASGSEAVHAFPKDTVTALEAMTIIGGVAEARADAQGILILRRYPVTAVTEGRSGPDHPRTVFTIDLTSADGLFSADQFLIQPGDLIYVTESPIVAARSIFGLLGSVIGLSNQVN